VLALAAVELSGQKMQRGDVKVFKTGERYSPPKMAEYLEVVIKPGHPKVMAQAPVRLPHQATSFVRRKRPSRFLRRRCSPASSVHHTVTISAWQFF